MAALSLALGEVNELSVPHMIKNGFKNLAAISLETDLKIKQLGALTSAPAPAPAPAKKEDKKEDKKAVKEEVKPVEEDIGIDIFGME